MFIYFVHNGFFEKLTRFCEPSCPCVSISNPFTLQRAAFTCESLVLGWGPCSAVRPGVPRRLHVQLLGSVPRTSLCSVKPFPCGQLRSVSGLTSAGARGLPSACTRRWDCSLLFSLFVLIILLVCFVIQVSFHFSRAVPRIKRGQA